MKILCYGDSNTFGYDPRGYFGGRYDDPWPELLGKLTGWEVRNNGMNGRQIPKSAVVFPKDADRILLMLGTNDLLSGADAGETARRMGEFLQKNDTRKVILLPPPHLWRGEWVADDALVDQSQLLPELYAALGVPCIDTSGWDIPMAYDGVHFTEDGHRIFAENLAGAISAVM